MCSQLCDLMSWIFAARLAIGALAILIGLIWLIAKLSAATYRQWRRLKRIRERNRHDQPHD